MAKIKDLFGTGKAVFSFEIFPPKRNDSIETIYDTVEQLYTLNPDFISVTYVRADSWPTTRRARSHRSSRRSMVWSPQRI